MAKEKILIADDEKSMRDFLGIMLKKEGYVVSAFETAELALEHFKQEPSELVISDLKMPGMGGLGLLRGIKELDKEAVVIVITAFASVDTAIEAMKAGAYDYFTKPFNIDDITLHVKRALEWRRLGRENLLLKKDFKTRFGLGELVGTSTAMKEIYELVMSIAPTKTNVFITGESGTGKELIARALHSESDRREMPFVTVNCGAIPENLLESELFGHVKGAFTGAVANKKGLAELADGGTLFLDEITELPLPLQVKLLRFIQERNLRRVGGLNDITVDLRIIAATNREIEVEVREGRFREDLFYRLNVIRIESPPLRERRQDIPQLARHFVGKYAKELGKDVVGIAEDALEALVGYDFGGNVRELENIIERAVALERGERITPGSLPPGVRGAAPASVVGAEVDSGAAGEGAQPASLPPGTLDLDRIVSDYEKRVIREALERAGGGKKKAAEMLGITLRSLRYKLQKYEEAGIDVDANADPDSYIDEEKEG